MFTCEGGQIGELLALARLILQVLEHNSSTNPTSRHFKGLKRLIGLLDKLRTTDLPSASLEGLIEKIIIRTNYLSHMWKKQDDDVGVFWSQDLLFRTRQMILLLMPLSKLLKRLKMKHKTCPMWKMSQSRHTE